MKTDILKKIAWESLKITGAAAIALSEEKANKEKHKEEAS